MDNNIKKMPTPSPMVSSGAGAKIKRMPTPSPTMPKAKVRRLTSENGNEEDRKDRVSNINESNGSRSQGSDRLVQRIKNLQKNRMCSDVVLKNKDHVFCAHKVILSMWSPVFAAMFQHDIMEKETDKVDISDCTTEAFEVFLQFLYSGSVDTISSANVVDLYYIADKYQVEDLKTDCVKYMKNSLSVDTFCDIMIFSIRYLQDSDLKNAAMQFFCRNIKEIVKTDQWLKYLTENPKDANSLIIKALNT